MENKKEMNIVLASFICFAFVGVIVFISVNKKIGMDSNNNGSELSSGRTAQAGDMVAMGYTGKLEDGTVFDSNLDPKFGHVQPFIFTLGAGQVIPGWDKAIVGMKEGEKKTLVVPPEEAYGEEGIPGVIPPNATLTFEVELLAIKK